MKRILNWVYNLLNYTIEEEPKPRKHKVHLTKEEVSDLYDMYNLMNGLVDIEFIAEKYNISTATARRIVNGKHKYSKDK